MEFSQRWIEGIRGRSLLVYGGLLAMACPFLIFSWRRWPDEIVDSGRELYTAWRLSLGEQLYRDIDCVYGPLAQTLNGWLFRVFEPGLLILVTANLVAFAVLLGLVVVLFRRAWGLRGAAAAGTVLVVFCGFRQLGETGNYNYAFPYAHEVTLGMLALFSLVFGLSSWLRSGGVAWAGFAGLCWGSCWVLKPEFIFAGGMAVMAALAFARNSGRGAGAAECCAAGAGLVGPTFLFATAFARDAGWAQGWRQATTAWRLVASGEAVDLRFQTFLAGWNKPWTNFITHLEWTAGLLVSLLALTLLAQRVSALRRRWLAWSGAVGLLILVAWGFSRAHVADGWPKSWLGLVLIYLLARDRTSYQVRPERILLALVGAGLMARMMLWGRLHHFGFYQAAGALMVLAAVMIAEWPSWIREDNRWARRLLAASAVALFAGYGSAVVAASTTELRQRTLRIGTGPDAFYARPPPRPYGAWLNFAQEVLRREGATGSLLVVPEGLMLNYLTRMPSPVPPFFLFSFATRDGAEARLVARLEQNPPGWIVALSRNLSEYGIARYGEREGEGRLLLDWIDRHYEPVASAEGRHPFSSPKGDLWVLRRRTSPE